MYTGSSYGGDVTLRRSLSLFLKRMSHNSKSIKMSSSKCHLGLSLLSLSLSPLGGQSFTHRKTENYITLHVLQSESVCHI